MLDWDWIVEAQQFRKTSERAFTEYILQLEMHTKYHIEPKLIISIVNCWKKSQYVIKQADYLLLYEQNWLKEGTEALVLKKTAESSKYKPIPNWQIWLAHSYSAILHKKFACFIYGSD